VKEMVRRRFWEMGRMFAGWSCIKVGIVLNLIKCHAVKMCGIVEVWHVYASPQQYINCFTSK
jgi:hypothetical protein